jgi:dihydrofolate reductase
MLYSVGMSVDGFITGAGGDMSWMVPYLGPNPTIDDLVSQIGSLLVGRRTFGGDDPYKGTDGQGEAFGGAWSGPQVVLTHHAPDAPVDGVTFESDFGTALAAAKNAAGDKYVNVLGADVARQCVEAGVLDEVLVCIAPVMLGDGVRLFAEPGGRKVDLERISVTYTELSTNLWFRVVR